MRIELARLRDLGTPFDTAFPAAVEVALASVPPVEAENRLGGSWRAALVGTMAVWRDCYCGVGKPLHLASLVEPSGQRPEGQIIC